MGSLTPVRRLYTSTGIFVHFVYRLRAALHWNILYNTAKMKVRCITPFRVSNREMPVIVPGLFVFGLDDIIEFAYYEV
jgi:hypothetical protein